MSPTTAWLGIELVTSTGDGAVLRMPARPEMANRSGMVHGGFIALLADTAMGRAVAAVLPDGHWHASFDLKTSFIAPGRIGEALRAVATVLHSGRRTAVAECRIEDEDGRLVATATATFIVQKAET